MSEYASRREQAIEACDKVINGIELMMICTILSIRVNCLKCQIVMMN